MSVYGVSGHNATDKTPMNEMPLIFVFGFWGLGFWGWGEHFLYMDFGCWRFVIGVLSRFMVVSKTIIVFTEIAVMAWYISLGLLKLAEVGMVDGNR